MPYYSTKDEKYNFFYSAGEIDLDDRYGYGEYGQLAEGEWAYGYLPENFPADEDIFDLGFLTPGRYNIEVEEYTWDYDAWDIGKPSEFSILNSSLRPIETERSLINDIEFTVKTNSKYYASVKGDMS